MHKIMRTYTETKTAYQFAAQWHDKSGIYIMETEAEARELYDALRKNIQVHERWKIMQAIGYYYDFAEESGE